MPRITYRTYAPKAETRTIIDQADGILVEYSRQGFSLTLRQLYYQFIARDLFPDSYINEAGTKNSIQSYNKLKAIISKAREGGMLDWSHVKDRGRELEAKPHWDDAEDFLSSVAPQFNCDRWAEQPTRVEVWVEKDALSEVLARACRPYDVAYMATKGYISVSTIWEAAHNRFLRYWNDYGQETVVIHLTDHDPSGIDMERDIRDRLRVFATQYQESQLSRGNPVVHVDRIALTMAQIEQYNPPPNPAKETDSRFAHYESHHGNESWELDALDPGVIVRMIQARIRNYMDRALYDERVAQEREWRASLLHMARYQDEAMAALPPLDPDDYSHPGDDDDIDTEDD